MGKRSSKRMAEKQRYSLGLNNAGILVVHLERVDRKSY